MSEVQNPNPQIEEVKKPEVETKKRVFKCRDCGAEFQTKAALLKHRREAHGVVYKWQSTEETPSVEGGSLVSDDETEEPEAEDHSEARHALADRATNWLLNHKNEIFIAIGIIAAAILSGIAITHYRKSQGTESQAPAAESTETPAEPQAPQVMPTESASDDL